MDYIRMLQQALRGFGYAGSINDFLAVFGLALTRVLTAVSLSPLLGGKSVPSQVRLGLSVMVTILLFPSLAPGKPAPDSALLWIALMAKEAMIGLTIGFLVQLLLFGIQTAGALIDVQRGMDQPGLHTPQLAGNASVLGIFQFQVAVVIFLFLNGHLMFLRAIADSFQRLPLLDFPALSSNVAMAELLGRISGQLFVVALQLSAPVLLTLFLVDVIFAIVNKIASQVNVHQESQPVKAFVALLILVPSIGLIFSRAGELLSRMIWNIYDVFTRFS